MRRGKLIEDEPELRSPSTWVGHRLTSAYRASYITQRLLDLTPLLEPAVQNIEVGRHNAKKLAADRPVLPGPPDTCLDVDRSFSARQLQPERQYISDRKRRITAERHSTCADIHDNHRNQGVILTQCREGHQQTVSAISTMVV